MNDERFPLSLNTPHPRRHPHPTAKATRLTHLIFERPDLENCHQFLRDFGLVTVCKAPHTLYLRGVESAPYCYRVHLGARARFVGFGLQIESRDELIALSRLQSASGIAATSAPGGGEQVVLTDPSGFVVEAIYGQSEEKSLSRRPALPLNQGGRLDRINATQRAPLAPPEILRLGHVVLEVANYQATCAWYTEHFGLIPSDVQMLNDGTPIVSFLRLDLGEAPADHHTIALAQGFMSAYSHSAFEVVDTDAIGIGQRVLQKNGWTHAWGMGRHILGSQIFDYWQDPWGDKHEHYCDGDLFTSDRPTGFHKVSAQAMSQWGQRMPKSFTKPKITLRNIQALLYNLRHSPDLTLRKLIILARLFA